MPNPTNEKIEAIRRRLNNYLKYKNVFDRTPLETEIVASFMMNAERDIEFLLESLDALLKNQKL